MSDQSGDRNRTGTDSDRKMTTASATAIGAGASLAIGFTDWFFGCYQGGQFAFVAPNQQLIEMSAPLIVLPIGLWIGKIFGLIGDIIEDKLERDAGGQK